jgi:hypothetical protein
MDHLLFGILLRSAQTPSKLQGCSTLAIAHSEVELAGALAFHACHLFLDATLVGCSTSVALKSVGIDFVAVCFVGWGFL